MKYYGDFLNTRKLSDKDQKHKLDVLYLKLHEN